MRFESESSSSVDPKLVPLPAGEYEVFLSFRGPDVRQTFADCLYSCLIRAKIRTFRDEEGLQKGETIGPSLVKAITESKIYIPIFTEGYASSKWCLQELAKMVDCWKTGRGGGGKGQHVILPVFYFIDSRDVRHQDSGPYKEAFEQHSLKHDMETISEWKEALQEVGKMKGWHVTELDGQGAIIDDIFTEVELHLRDGYTLVTDELVGIDSRVETIVERLNLDSAAEKIVGIHGMGGLGKTTLAKAVYNKVSMQFERSCFLENVRDALSKSDGALTLQNQVISDILKQDSNQAKNTSDGVRIMRDRVSRHKLLIVLDDVDERFQFDDILGKLSNFSIDSRFIITTRDARVLELLQECKLFELEEMSHDHSLTLFCKHAFRVGYPPEDYASLSEELVQVAAGLPLALKVIGSLLFQTDKLFWEDKLRELKDIPPAKVQERLKISYNELTHNEKQIFLDVACLFVGENKALPTYMWSDCDFYPTSTIRTLVQRSLIKINHENSFWMHDQVRDLGRAIVREENNQNGYTSSRIWSSRDAIHVLKHEERTDCVEALVIDMEGENEVLNIDDFKKFPRLRFLEVRYGRLARDDKEVLPNLRWLKLYRCDSIPNSFILKKLVNLDVRECSVGDGWKGWDEIKVARKLKFLYLWRCFNLNEVPDLSNCRELEFLQFDECEMMCGELHVGNFKNLKVLKVRKTKVTRLLGDIGMLHSLQQIDVRHTSLVEVPAGISKLLSLERLDLTFIHPDKPDITEMFPTGLKSLGISSPFHSTLPSSLISLDFFYCEHLQRLPDLSNLTNLKNLRLNKVGIREIPGLGELKLLTNLVVESAPNLDNLDGLENLVLLKVLNVEGCLVLKKLPSLATLTRLYILEIGMCPVLAEIHGVGELRESLTHLNMRECPGLTSMDALHSMVKLETFVLEGPEFTTTIPSSLSMFTQLKRLAVSHVSLEQFPDLSNLNNLRDVMITSCEELIEVTGLDTLESLEFLGMGGCRSMRKLDLSGRRKLTRLDVTGCTQLTEVKGLGRLESLEYLWISGCKSIKELPNLSGLKNLREMHMRNCRQLKEVNGLEGLESLQVFAADKRLKLKYVLKWVPMDLVVLIDSVGFYFHYSSFGGFLTWWPLVWAFWVLCFGITAHWICSVLVLVTSDSLICTLIHRRRRSVT